MPNVIASGTSVVNGTIKRNNFLIGVNTSVQYGPTSATTFWNGIVPATSGYTVYAQKTVNGPSIRTAANDAELITIAKQYGGTNITTIYDALSYFNGQSNNLVTNIDYPNIVTSGLTILLDAAYVPSYPTTGTTWNDLSGNGNNSTLINSPTYSTLGGGSILFNGSNSYASGLTQNSSTYTISIWGYNLNNTTVGGGFISTATAPSVSANAQIQLGGGTIPFQYNTVYINNSTATKNQWVMLTGVQSSTTQQLFINGTSVASFATTSNLGDYYNIGRRTDGVYLNTYIAIAQIYNRALSATEVLQNYNATKSRFGL
jgi:hypothetical protein